MKYKIDEDYPDINNLDIHLEYGQLLLSYLGGLHSKMNAVSLYFYNSIILSKSYPELSNAFHEIFEVELHHLEILGKMCFLLGADPRLWDCQNDFLEYWSPGYNVYPRMIPSLLENAIIQEQNTMSIYNYHINTIKEPIITDMLKRMMKDEQHHIDIFHHYLKEYKKSDTNHSIGS